jgi:DNA-binding NarL/FixJ family response regulator
MPDISVEVCSVPTREQWSGVAAALDMTPRQQQVAMGILANWSEEAIGNALGITGHGVHKHVAALHRNLHVTSQIEFCNRIVAERDWLVANGVVRAAVPRAGADGVLT